jgi:hypothetical protein
LNAEGGSVFLLDSLAPCFPRLALSNENGEPFLDAGLLVPGLLSCTAAHTCPCQMQDSKPLALKLRFTSCTLSLPPDAVLFLLFHQTQAPQAAAPNSSSAAIVSDPPVPPRCCHTAPRILRSRLLEALLALICSRSVSMLGACSSVSMLSRISK